MSKYGGLQLQFDLDVEMKEDWEADAERSSISFEEARQISAAAKQAFEDWMKDTETGGNGELKVEGWFSDYVRLLEQGWPWRVAAYIAWAASPKVERWPKTLQDLATDVLGLTGPRTVYNWRQKYPGIDATVAVLQAAPLLEHRRDVIEALVEMARTPDYKAHADRKLFLEMIGDYTPRSKLELGRSTGGDAVEEMSDEELRRWMGSAEGAEEEENEPQMNADEHGLGEADNAE